MQALKDAIVNKGLAINSSIIKVDSFLNHRLDSKLLFQMGEAFAEYFSNELPDLILTIEASGIALALATAHALNDIPVVFAKKSKALNQSSNMAQEKIHSFTQQTDFVIRADLRYIPKNSKVLIIDDFLANGEAVKGLMGIIKKADAKLVGIGIAIEKGFQQGGSMLRAQGLPLLSLAVIDEIKDGNIRFRSTEEKI